MKKTLFLISLVLVTISGQAQFRKYSNEFLNIGVGARALAMGNTQTALTDDVTSAYWNPAGLMQMKSDLEVAAMHSEYFTGVAKYDYIGATVPISDKSRRLGLALVRFAVDDIPNTLYLYQPDGSVNYDNVTSFSSADYAGIVSYAQDIKSVKGLTLGINAKIIHRTVGSFAQSWGFGADAGIQYRHNNLILGAMVRDITTTYNAWSFSFSESDKAILQATNNVIPTSSTEYTAPKIILGGGYSFRYKNGGVTPCLDIDITTDGKRNTLISSSQISADPHAGVEFDYKKIIYLRAGVNNIQKATDDVTGKNKTLWQPNAGVGIHIKNAYIDYAYTNLGNGNVVPNSHVISLKLNFSKK